MRVSIVIPVLKVNDYIRESIPEIMKLNYDNFEVLILPNQVTEDEKKEFAHLDKVRLISSIEGGPAYKRDLGVKESTGEIIAFLDDDAYPKVDWVEKALKHFKDEKVGAVGGPGVTPNHDTIRQKASGAIFTSNLGGGNLTYRYRPGKKVMEVDDFPSVNLLVRKSVFQEIGGFDSNYWPGEDTKLCHDIVSAGHKIMYDPEVFVWHHRRSSLLKHLKQVWNYAKHRGHFVKKFPKNSLHLNYFLPSLFILGLFLGGIFTSSAFVFSWFRVFVVVTSLTYIYLIVVFVYIIALFISGLIEAWRIKNIWVGFLVMPAIFFTHVVYGVGFLFGLSKRNL